MSVERGPVFGALSLAALCGAVLTGFLTTLSIASHTEEMASMGAIAGIGFGFIVSILAPAFGLAGLMRHEKPLWPAIIGLVLGLVPGLIGLWLIVSISGIAFRHG